jgi:hypothetical protein
VKKLAIGVLIVWVAAACRRQAVVTSVPSQPASTAPAVSNAAGGATAQEALAKFLAAGKAQDLQAMSNVWGTKQGGAASTGGYMPREEMEKRLIIMIKCTRNDSWAIKSEMPLIGGDRQFTVELRLKNLTGVTDFVAVQGPNTRWYISQFDPEKLMRTICQAP